MSGATAEDRPIAPPSELFERHAARLEEAARLGPIVDLACGRGRHAFALARRGLHAIGLDRNADSLRTALALAATDDVSGRIECVETDLETANGIPLKSNSCGGILVFCFLFRPLAPEIVRVLAPGGLLLYETFTLAQRDLPSGPSNPAFLLADGELPSLFPGLEIEHHAESIRDGRTATARLAARKSR